ncbi:type III pantothenate kinase [Aestuariibacter salexigens]|uniref:type III pantothenate kinase n=1 Tax=Aestuariibacter salexigens TaxID=226010 RepID=UPI00146F9668|nr:type III pantothenate kinase [Aestuariibacter salexigens]
MSDQPSILLIDVGNTRTKYCWQRGNSDISEVDATTQIETLSERIGEADKVVVACVGHDDWLAAIQQASIEQKCELVTASVSATHNNISCAYENVLTLGVDRWLGIIAAQQLTDKPYAVLQLGTAMTCDVVADRVHQGGWIAPGYQLMKRSVTQNTAKVFCDESNVHKLSLGRSTPECVSHGCIAALNGFVQQTVSWMQQHHNSYDIFISGGDADLVNIDEGNVTKIEHIVLRGLASY